ncbi:MAG: HD domain-containing protein [Myxococcota bacterium]
MSPAIEAKEAVTQARQHLRDRLPHESDGAVLLATFSRAVERTVTALAETALADVEALPGRMVLLAVGALARGELGPHSDLDLVLLTEHDNDPGEVIDEVARRVAHPLWDAGLRPNLTVHTGATWLSEATGDLPLCTELLDARPLCGDGALAQQLRQQARARYFGSARVPFLERIEHEAQERHGRYGGTVYLVEPDLKHGPGGLRDWAATRWCLTATHGHADLERLQAQGSIGPRVAGVLRAARGQLLRLRAALQLAAKRGQDRLVFQYQEVIPPLLGLLPDQRVPDARLVDAIEQAMQGYFRAAHDMLRYGHRVRSRCRPAARPPVAAARRLDERFSLRDGTLCATEPDLFVESPVLCLEALALARDHDVQVSGEIFDSIVEAVGEEGAARLQGEPEAQRRLLTMLVEPEDGGRPSALALCSELRLLERVIPEWGPIRGRMQHDSYHVYTVDQHTLSAVAMLKRIARGEHNKDYPLATALHLSIDDPTVLYLATLVHDAGKAEEGDQCETGAVIARRVAERAGLAAPEVDRCAQLVAEHLTMPMLSQKRDLSDPLLIVELAERIADRRLLTELYLLSLVDMACVRPGNLSSWKLTLLDELYLLTLGYLRRGHRITAARVPQPDEPEGMPDRYYALYERGLRRAHFALGQRLRAEQRRALLDLQAGAGSLRLTLVARDRPGLLAQAAAVFDEHDVEVLAADVFTQPLEPTIAIDIFRVAPRDASAAGIDPATLAAMEQALERPRGGTPGPPAARPRRPWDSGLRVPTVIGFGRDPAGERTIVDVTTAEAPGVLRRITQAFHDEGHEILLARCDTEADRASDVFYVAPLSESAQARLRQRLERYLR